MAKKQQRKLSVGEKIRMIQRGKKLDAATGMLYTNAKQRRGRWRAIVLWSLFVSDEQTFLVRPHLFETKKSPRTAAQWHAWFEIHYGRVLPDILAGMNIRTEKFWRIYRVIGWTPGKRFNDYSQPNRSSLPKRRNKTKPQRR